MLNSGRQVLDEVTGLAKAPARVKFGTAGIRGIYGQEVSIRETLAVCYAVDRMLGQGRFGVGYDTRMTSSLLAGVTCSAMNWYGSDVDDYGVIPTPVLAFNIRNNKLQAGFSVTASHNPPEYAGVKVYGTDGIEFSLEAEHRLEDLIQKSTEVTRRGIREFGSTNRNEEAVSSYIDAVLKSVDRKAGGGRLRVLVDCANGTAGKITPSILSTLGHDVVTVNAHESALFPGRMPEPMVETLGEVAEFSRRIGADLTVCHDGDADRLVMIDERGRIVPDYALACLLLQMVIERSHHGTVIISVNSSRALEELALRNGCKVQRSRLGKTFEELYKRRGIFACEPSKVVDPRWGYWEDGIYAAVLVVQYLASRKESLSEVLSSIPKYWNLQRNVEVVSAVDYSRVKEKMSERFSGEIASIDELDGVKFHLKDDSWMMYRSSGTEKKVRIYVESKSEEKASELMGVALDFLNVASREGR